jgi:hypothetical protein
VSKLEHSPSPWSCGDTAIYDRNGLVIAVASGWQGAWRKWDANSELIAVAPTMYGIIRQICSTDSDSREQGLQSAQFLLRELEGRSDAES